MPEQNAAPIYPTYAPDAEWKALWETAPLNPLTWRLEDGSPMLELHRRLVSLGGWAVCVRDADIAPALLTEGSAASGAGAEMRMGRPRDCHDNCRELTRQDPTLSWHHGYALSTDGMWREHSWCVKPDGGIVETTVERVAYYGAPQRD